MTEGALKFTRQTLDKLSPTDKRATYRDAETRGLTLEVTPNGVKSFRVYRKVQGKPERITLGRFNAALPDSREFPQGTDLMKALLGQPELNVRMARRLAEAVNVQLDAGLNPAEAKRKARGEMTLGQAYERYLEEHVGPRRLRAGRAIMELYERYIGELPDRPVKKHGAKRTKAPFGVNWHSRRLSTITREELRKLHTAAGRTLAGSTANKILDLVNRLYRKAASWGEFTGTSPATGIEPFPEVKKDRYLKSQELPLFWQTLQVEPDQDFRDFVLLSLLAGAREGNNLAMRYEDIDFDTATWRVPGEKSKNGDPLIIVLVPEALEILARRRAESLSPWVFPAARVSAAKAALSDPGPRTAFRRRWRRFRIEAGVPDLNVHDLRRSLGSWQARTGASLLIIGKTLGHKSAQATQIYARLDTDPVRDAVERATSTMLAVARGESAEIRKLERSGPKRA